MIGSGAFNYVNVLDKAADASWLRSEVISNNIANVNTPNYKRKDVQFESYLLDAMAGEESVGTAVRQLDLDSLDATVYTEHSNLSYRFDGNNVDINTESSELAKNQLRYYTLVDLMSQEFKGIKSVLSKNS